MNPDGSIAFVSGANRGIGKAFAYELLARGATKVYGAVRDPATIDDERLTPVAFDVTDLARVDAVARQLTDVTLVINNAGIARPGTALTATIEDARAEITTNYLGLIATTQAFAPVLAANGGGAFVNMLSVASWVGIPLIATYAASKSAAWGYTNAARIALKGQGTHVVSVHVGFVDTDLAARVPGEKVAPNAVAAAALDALAAGEPEAIVDERSRDVKDQLSDDLGLIYPALQADFDAAAAATSR